MPQFDYDANNPDRPFFSSAAGGKVTDRQGYKIPNQRNPFLNKNKETHPSAKAYKKAELKRLADKLKAKKKYE